MNNGTYNHVICSSLWGVSFSIAIWCETPWGRDQNTTPCCNFNVYILSESTQNTTFDSGQLPIFPSLSSAKHTAHCICLPFWGQWSLFCTLSLPMERLVFPIGWCEVKAPFYPLLSYRLEVNKVKIAYCQSTVCLSVSVSSFHCHYSSN